MLRASAGLQARGHRVEAFEAGWHAGDELAPLVQLLELVHGLAGEILDRQEAALDLVLSDLEDTPLGLVDDVVGILFARDRRRNNGIRRRDEVPQRRLVLDDAGVLRHVQRPRQPIHQGREIAQAAGTLELAGALETLRHRHRIDGGTVFGKRHHRLEDDAVCFAVKILGSKGFAGRINGRVVEQDGPKNGPLRIQIIRQRPPLGDLFGHGASLARISQRVTAARTRWRASKRAQIFNRHPRDSSLRHRARVAKSGQMQGAATQAI